MTENRLFQLEGRLLIIRNIMNMCDPSYDIDIIVKMNREVNSIITEIDLALNHLNKRPVLRMIKGGK